MNNIAGRLEKETQFYKKMEIKLQGMPEIFSKYCNSMRANRKAYTTVGVYISNILHFANFVGKGEVTEDFYKHISSSDVESYMISLETRETKNGIKRMGDDILQARWSALNTFFEWLIQREQIQKNPMRLVSRPKNNTEHKVTFLTKSEINKLFRAVDNNPNKVMATRDKALFSLAISTGMRASAIVNINKEDIIWGDGIIKVIEKRQKIREIPIGENTINILKEWIYVRDKASGSLNSTALFVSQKNGRLSPDAANDALKKYCSEAGIQKRITLHKLRSSAATSLAAAKVDIQTIGNILGHRSTATTLRYVAVLDENKKNAVGILDNLV
jgi:site-specific recombinase XerD